MATIEKGECLASEEHVQKGLLHPCGKENVDELEEEQDCMLKDEFSKQSDRERPEISDTSEQLCFGCKHSLNKSPQLICVSGFGTHKWHPECFRCTICQDPMDKRQTCHLFREQIICKNDYEKLRRNVADFSPEDRAGVKCAKCKWKIDPTDWVRKAADLVYHLACFSCDVCFRQLNTGDQFTIDASGLPLHSQLRLLCRYHFSIRENNHSNMDHREESPLNNCQDHQSRPEIEAQRQEQLHFLTSSTSRSVNQQSQSMQPVEPRLGSLSPTSYSSDANGHRLQHLDSETLMTKLGSPPPAPQIYGPNTDNRVYSRPQIELHQRSTSSSSSKSTSSYSTSSLSSSSPTIHLSSSAAAMLMQQNHLNSAPASSNSNSCVGSSSSKSKRVRTTFTDDQLSILQTHFQIDSNPDGQDLERIATITGLSKRVTQVWFQNSRARQKKYLVKKKP